MYVQLSKIAADFRIDVCFTDSSYSCCSLTLTLITVVIHGFLVPNTYLNVVEVKLIRSHLIIFLLHGTLIVVIL
jgi:hypothetical protein